MGVSFLRYSDVSGPMVSVRSTKERKDGLVTSDLKECGVRLDDIPRRCVIVRCIRGRRTFIEAVEVVSPGGRYTFFVPGGSVRFG